MILRWEPGTGAVLIGEVSQCNDDNTDNRFNPPAGRFPEIEEDEPPYRLLCNEYPATPENKKFFYMMPVTPGIIVYAESRLLWLNS